MSKKLRTILVDDEPSGIRNLEKLLQEFCPVVTIVGKAHNFEVLKGLLEKQEIDLVFLDVQINNSLIFNFLEDLVEINFEIIFVSAYNHALEAFRYRAVNYLLKPVDISELIKSVHLVYENIFRNDIFNEMTSSLSLSQESKRPKNVFLPTSSGYEIIAADSILYCIADGSYTEFVLEENKKIVVSQYIKIYERKLLKFDFIRIHKSYLINPTHVKKISRSDGGYLEMSDGRMLQVSKNKKDETMQKLMFHEE